MKKIRHKATLTPELEPGVEVVLDDIVPIGVLVSGDIVPIGVLVSGDMLLIVVVI